MPEATGTLFKKLSVTLLFNNGGVELVPGYFFTFAAFIVTLLPVDPDAGANELIMVFGQKDC